jgi:hypothetical protein
MLLQVSELTLKQLVKLQLKSGMRPPLLIEVLRSARHLGAYAQLVIELKPGNTATATALCQLLKVHPSLAPHVAVVMSFDAFVIHSFREEYAATFGSRRSTPGASPSHFRIVTREYK